MIKTCQIQVGTVKTCTVLDVARRRTLTSLLCKCDGDPENEATLCILCPDDAAGVAVGDRGRLVFTEGGPFGGFWKFEGDRGNAA